MDWIHFYDLVIVSSVSVTSELVHEQYISNIQEYRVQVKVGGCCKLVALCMQTYIGTIHVHIAAQ
jgi:hypothetical protein